MIKGYACILVFLIGLLSGWTVNGWRLSASNNKALLENHDRIAHLEAAIASQTAQIYLLGAQYIDAQKVAKTAQKDAANARKKVKPAKVASTCESAVDQLWESVQ